MLLAHQRRLHLQLQRLDELLERARRGDLIRVKVRGRGRVRVRAKVRVRVRARARARARVQAGASETCESLRRVASVLNISVFLVSSSVTRKVSSGQKCDT